MLRKKILIFVFLIKLLNILNKPIKTDIRINITTCYNTRIYRMALNYNYLNFFFQIMC